MLDISTLLMPKYWFSLAPAPLTGLTEKIMLLFFLFVFVVGAFFRFKSRAKKQSDRLKNLAWQNLSHCGLIMGSLGLLILFFSFENIRLFGSSFWYVFWLIGLLVWLAKIWHNYYHIAPQEKVKEEQRRHKAKYLPRKK